MLLKFARQRTTFCSFERRRNFSVMMNPKWSSCAILCHCSVANDMGWISDAWLVLGVPPWSPRGPSPSSLGARCLPPTASPVNSKSGAVLAQDCR